MIAAVIAVLGAVIGSFLTQAAGKNTKHVFLVGGWVCTWGGLAVAAFLALRISNIRGAAVGWPMWLRPVPALLVVTSMVIPGTAYPIVPLALGMIGLLAMAVPKGSDPQSPAAAAASAEHGIKS